MDNIKMNIFGLLRNLWPFVKPYRLLIVATVTLTFIGSNGISYEATWSVARARNKATGNLKSKEWQLLNLDKISV